MQDLHYYQVSGWMVSRLGLRGNDRDVFAIIYGFSQDGESWYTGSLRYLQEWLGVSKPTVMKSLEILCVSGLLIKESKTRTNIIFNRYRVDLVKVQEVMSLDFRGGGKDSLPVVNLENQGGGGKNSLPGGKNSLPGGGKNSLPNNTIIDNTIIKDIAQPTASLFPELENTNSKVLFKNCHYGKFENFEKKFESSDFQNVDLNYYFHAVNDWSESKSQKRTANGWIATARQFMRSDLEKKKLKLKTVTQDDPYMEYLKMS